MDTPEMLKNLIIEECSFPALKLHWEKQFEVEDLGEIPKITPSKYLKENSMTTDERHKLLIKQQSKMRNCVTEMEVKVEPPMIVFQSYKFGHTTRFPIAVRNVSKKPQKVALLMDESFVFKFDECSQRVGKFPCGMLINATVTFTPDSAADDYYHHLIVSANNTKLTVPIVAIGARPLLTAPDSLFLTDSPVRHWTVKPVTFLNTGKKTARFTLDTNGPFCIKPDKGFVAPSHAFTFEVAYFSRNIDFHEGKIRIKFDNDEEVFIDLKANAINYDIKLSSPDIRCEDTFISLQTRSVIYIQNNSSISAKFLWKKFPTPGQKESINGSSGKAACSGYDKTDSKLGEVEVDQVDELGKVDKFCLMDMAPYQEGFDDEGNVRIGDYDPKFYDDNFHVYPLFGEVKANSRMEIHVVFCPKETKFYEGAAYLDITGLDSRIPFQLYGRGLGPKFKLGFEILNVGEVALGGSHTYELPVQNTSEIAGIIQCDGLVGPSSKLGMKIEPPFLLVTPCQYSAFYVNFNCTGTVGAFEDEIKFSSRETGDAFYVTVMGKLTYPAINFPSTEFNIGNLSNGFTKTFSLPLVNDSLNYVQVQLRMENDGADAPIDYENLLQALKSPVYAIDGNPMEFILEPTKFTLVPRGRQNIQLTMFPNKVRDIRNKVMCFITDSSGHEVETVASINIKGCVVVPTLEFTSESLTIKDCYLNYATPTEVTIKNSSELPFVYKIVQRPHNGVTVTSDHFVGLADPWVEITIPLEVYPTHATGTVTYLDLYGAGVEDKVHSIALKCETVTSKVEAGTKNVDFGKVEILEDKIAVVDVNNMSPLTFSYTAVIFQDEPSDKGESWRVEPESGTLKSQDVLLLDVHLLMREIGFHYAGVRIQMTEPQTHTIEVRLKAQGVGCPLIFEPPLAKVLDYGTIFIKQDVTFDYKITNNGVNPQVIEWKQLGEKPPQNKLEGRGPFKKPATGKGDQSEKTGKKRKPAFHISPLKMTIPVGGIVDLSITAHSLTQKLVDETWNLWTYVPVTKALQLDELEKATTNTKGKKGAETASAPTKPPKSDNSKKKSRHPGNEPPNLHFRPDILQEVKVLASFESPGLKFSKRTISFAIDATPTQENFVAEEIVKVANTGRLPLQVKFKTKYPFMLDVHKGDSPEEEMDYYFEPGTVLALKIYFDGRHLRKELGLITFSGKLEAGFEGVHGTDSIGLKGSVSFPQLHLDRTEIDFGQITNGMEAVQQITVTNPGTFCLTYKWYIKPGSTSIQRNPKPSWTKDMYSEKYRPSLNDPLTVFSRRVSNAKRSAAAARDKFLESLGIKTSIYTKRRNSVSEEGFTGFLREKMYRSRMMEFMGLRDAEYEPEDEVNYLAYYNQHAISFGQEDEFNTNELIDVIPLAGLIQAGQSQTFTFVFYGYPDINFSASLILYVEGGARKTINVKGSTVPPEKAKSLSTFELEPPQKAQSLTALGTETEPIRKSKSFSAFETEMEPRPKAKSFSAVDPEPNRGSLRLSDPPVLDNLRQSFGRASRASAGKTSVVRASFAKASVARTSKALPT